MKQCMDAVLAQSQRSLFAEQGVDLATTSTNPLATSLLVGAAAVAGGGTGRPPVAPSARPRAPAQRNPGTRAPPHVMQQLCAIQCQRSHHEMGCLLETAPSRGTTPCALQVVGSRRSSTCRPVSSQRVAPPNLPHQRPAAHGARGGAPSAPTWLQSPWTTAATMRRPQRLWTWTPTVSRRRMAMMCKRWWWLHHGALHRGGPVEPLQRCCR